MYEDIGKEVKGNSLLMIHSLIPRPINKGYVIFLMYSRSPLSILNIRFTGGGLLLHAEVEDQNEE